MKSLIDMVCPNGHVHIDVLVDSLSSTGRTKCGTCNESLTRTWAFVKAPGITPQGTRPEVNTDRYYEAKVDTKAIAADTTFEIEQKWLRYSDETIAEEHVRREINEAAGIDNPPPTPDPLVFTNPAAARAV